MIGKIVETFTFDDVVLAPRFSKIVPDEVDLTTQFSRNVSLKIPLSSSPMDRVTEYQLAIIIAKCGGIGIIHRNLSIEMQIEEVVKVKRHQSTVIFNPYTLQSEDTIEKAEKLMEERGISGIPIINQDGKLLGILTRRDLQFRDKDKKLVKEIMTKDNLVTGSLEVTAKQAEEAMRSRQVEKFLLVDKEFHLQGLITAKDLGKSSDAVTDKRGQLIVGAAIGAAGDSIERAQGLINAGVDALVIDTAHGHSENVINTLKELKKFKTCPDVIVGNIATCEAADTLINCGADGLRVGIGPGSICTTRVVTGCGVPQLSAIKWAAQNQVPIIADGGIKYSGDIVKAIAAGASAVMVGSLFAATEESPSETIQQEGRLYKSYRGMGSEAVLKSDGDRYGDKAAPEGIEGMVPHAGSLENFLAQITAGIRQGMGYLGCKTIEELREAKITFCKITPAGLTESHVHDVTITKEAPNYRTRSK